MTPRLTPFDVRHGSRPIPAIPPITEEAQQAIREEARQAIIEHNRMMKEQRAFAAANRERIDAEWDALEAPPLTMAQHIDHARAIRMGKQA